MNIGNCLAICSRKLRHLQFICYESCPLDAGQVEEPVCSLKLSSVKNIPTRARCECEDLLTSSAYESRVECGSIHPANARRPGGPVPRFLSLQPEDLSPWPPVSSYDDVPYVPDLRNVTVQ